jgi:hypothetical protein
MSRPLTRLLRAALLGGFSPALLGPTLLVVPAPARADTGTVQVTAAIQSRISLTIGNGTADGGPTGASGTLDLSLDLVSPDGAAGGRWPGPHPRTASSMSRRRATPRA